ncbi:MAG: hypothetical protein LBC27_08850 [Spirochaetaceae bacterium]|nr:hypothetical protein [Spirochaetaceae bacterium]
MRKTVFIIIFAFIVMNSAYSYDAPPYGENLLLLGFPGLMSDAASVSGGGIFDAGPYSVILNPALTAPLQRVSANLGASILLKDENTGFAFLMGALLPSRWGVWTALAQGALLDLPFSPPGNMFNGRLGWSRDISENLYVGASVFAGITSNYGTGYAAALDLGFVYRVGKLGFLKDARVSVAAANLGKTFGNDLYSNFPGSFALKGGFAALLFENNNFSAGFSADAAFPTFQNMVLNLGVELNIIKMITVSCGWDMNVHEFANNKEMHGPSVGIGFKWTANIGASGIMMNQGWEQTDVNVSAVYQTINNSINLFSAGVSAQFGSIDRDPPVIKLGGAES